MKHGSVCVAMEVRQQACGGHSSTFPPRLALNLFCFSAFPPHFLSSFCSVTLSLLTLPLSLSPTNALSHHCLSLSLSKSSILPPIFLFLVNTHFLSFTPLLLFPQCLFPLSVCNVLFSFSFYRYLPPPSHQHEVKSTHISNKALLT